MSGSQEGAFENIKLNFNGDQGQTMRQLVNTHVVQHKAMCLLVAQHGKRQQMAVAHDKGKVCWYMHRHCRSLFRCIHSESYYSSLNLSWVLLNMDYPKLLEEYWSSNIHIVKVYRGLDLVLLDHVYLRLATLYLGLYMDGMLIRKKNIPLPDNDRTISRNIDNVIQAFTISMGLFWDKLQGSIIIMLFFYHIHRSLFSNCLACSNSQRKGRTWLWIVSHPLSCHSLCSTCAVIQSTTISWQ